MKLINVLCTLPLRPIQRSAFIPTSAVPLHSNGAAFVAITLSNKKNIGCRYNMKNKCLSCGYDKEYPQHPLCKYCYYRGTTGAAKFLLFQTMRDNGNKYMTVDELTELVNKNPNRKHKVKRNAVYNILHRYSRHYEQAKKRRRGYLVLKKEVPRKKGQRGRPQVKYKLSSRLLKRVDVYENRWKRGFTINKRVNKGEKFRMTIEYKERARGILTKIRKGEYDLYTYLLV